MPVSEAGPLVFNQVINIPSSGGIANLALTSGIAQQVAIPNGARSCAFAFNADYWVTFGTTAVSQTFSSYSSAGSTLALHSAHLEAIIREFPPLLWGPIRRLRDAEKAEHLTLQVGELGVEGLDGTVLAQQRVPLGEAE